jgi:two-component system, OmpR family, sensor kinase
VFRSLRSRLVAALALVILLCLTLAGSAFVVLLRDYQTRIALNQLADIALPLSFQVGVLERSGSEPAEIGRFLQDQASDLDVRLLLLDSRGVIVADSEGQWQGQTIPMQGARQFAPARPGQWGIYHGPDGQEIYYVATGPRELRPPRERTGDSVSRARPPDPAPTYTVALAVPVASVAESWLRLAPMLTLAGAIALLVSVVVAALLARSIAKPIAEITQASERMALGDYEQHITESGSDELAKLAASFNRMAQEVARSHRTLKDFLVNVSHELRTPLTSVQGFSQAMVDGTIQTSEEFADAGRIIENESGRMRRLVEDLLELSRLESGQVIVASEPVEFGGLIGASVQRARRWADERGVTLTADLPALPVVQGDELRLEEVVTNLLENAVKHTPTGGRIEVKARTTSVPDDPGRTQVVVEVHNSGSYIPPDQLPRVWERFYQVDRSRAASGSGLGLAIVAEIVQAHGGTVSARSDQTNGTTFAVSVPTRPPSAKASPNGSRAG